MCLNHPTDAQSTILIIGGGPAGLSLAAHLLTAGWNCRVVERRTRESLLADTNSFYDMAASGIQALLRIANGAAAPAIFDAAVAFDKIALYDGGKDTPKVNLEWKGRSLGMPMFNITRAALLSVLCEAVEELDPNCIEYESSARLMDHSLGTVEVDGPNGKRTLQADLIVGADGIHSRVRKHLFGDTGLRSDGIVACYAVLPPLTPEEQKTFPPKPTGVGDAYCTMSMAPDFMEYTVINATASIWYANFVVDGKPYVGLPPAPENGWLEEVRRRCKGGIPAMEALIERTKEEEIQVVVCCDRVPLDTYSRGRVVLVGDAAHPFTPFAGLGSSQAMVDAFCLGEALLHCNSPEEAVKTFEKQRVKPANSLMNQSRELCGTSLGMRIAFGILSTAFSVGKLFGKAEEVAELFMTIDGDSMVNKIIPFASKEEEEAYEIRYQEAKDTLKAQLAVEDK